MAKTNKMLEKLVLYNQQSLDNSLKELDDKSKTIRLAIDYPYKMEYIGKTVRVLKALNKEYRNIEGLVVEETKNTLKILKRDRFGRYKITTIFKKGSIFNIQGFILNGDWILKRPEERIKARLDIHKIRAFNKMFTKNFSM